MLPPPPPPPMARPVAIIRSTGEKFLILLQYVLCVCVLLGIWITDVTAVVTV
jgi:hypothetical protein